MNGDDAGSESRQYIKRYTTEKLTILFRRSTILHVSPQPPPPPTHIELLIYNSHSHHNTHSTCLYFLSQFSLFYSTTCVSTLNPAQAGDSIETGTRILWSISFGHGRSCAARLLRNVSSVRCLAVFFD